MSKIIQPIPGLAPKLSHQRVDQQLAWWLFNEGDGKVVNDLVKQQNGDAVNAPTWQGSPFGNSLKFDGSDQYVNTSLSVEPQAHTICLWIKKDGTSPGWFVAQRGSGGDTLQFWGRSDDFDQLMHYFNGSTVIDSTVTIPNDTWTHIAIVHDGSEVHFYKDGVFDVTRTLSLGSSSTETVQLMRDNVGNYANGAIQDLRIWQRALPAEEIKQIYEFPYTEFNSALFTSEINGLSDTLLTFSQTVEPNVIGKAVGPASGFKPVPGRLPNLANPRLKGLVSWWLFNEQTGNKLVDVIENQEASLVNFDSPPNWGESIHGSGLIFDGDDDFANVGDLKKYELDTFTIAVWIKFNAIPSVNSEDNDIFTKINPSTDEREYRAVLDEIDQKLHLQLSDDGTAGGSDATSPSTFYNVKATKVFDSGDVGKWFHLVFVKDGGQGFIYIDGVDKTDYDFGNEAYTTLFHGSAEARIGGNDVGSSSTNQSLDGVLDDVRFYNRALPLSEAKSLFEQPYIEFQTSHAIKTTPTTEASSSIAFSQSVSGEIEPKVPLTWVESPFGQAVDFDQDSISTDINIPSTNHTLTAWVYNKGDGEAFSISQEGTFEFYADSEGFLNYDNGTSVEKSERRLPVDKWVHVAVTFDTNQARFYINGRLDVTKSTGPTASTSNKIVIGQRSDDTFATGKIADLRIYEEVLEEDVIYTIATEPLREFKSKGFPAKYAVDVQTFNKAVSNSLTFSQTLERTVDYTPFASNSLTFSQTVEINVKVVQASNTLTFSQATTRNSDRERSLSSSLVFTHTVAPLRDITLNVSNDINLIQGVSVSTVAASFVQLQDSLNISHQLDHNVDYQRSASNSFTFAQTAAAIKGVNQSLTNSINFSQSVFVEGDKNFSADTHIDFNHGVQVEFLQTHQAQLSNSLSFSQSLTAAAGIVRDIEQSVSFLQAISTVRTADRLSDGNITFSQAVNAQTDFSRSASNALTFAQDVQAIVGTTVQASNIFAFSQDLTGAGGLSRPLEQSVGFTQSVSENVDYTRSVPHSVVFSHTVSSNVDRSRSLDNALTFAQDVQVSVQATSDIQSQPQNTITFNQDLTTEVVRPEPASNILAFSQALSRNVDYGRSISSSVVITQQLSTIKELGRSITQNITFAQSVESGFIRNVSVSNSLTFNHSLGSLSVKAKDVSVQSTFSFNQEIDTQFEYNRTVTHSLAFSQTVGTFATIERSLSQSITFSQSIGRVADVSNSIQFTQSARKIVEASASNSITFSHAAGQMAEQATIVTFVSSASAEVTKGPSNAVEFTQTIDGWRFVSNPSFQTSLTFEHDVTYYFANKGQNTKEFTPGLDEDAPAPFDPDLISV